MKEITIGRNEAQMRLDKYLEKLLPGAGISFLYKMLRKKNITLNGKRAQGNEHLREHDVIRVFFAEETYEKFRMTGSGAKTAGSRGKSGVSDQKNVPPADKRPGRAAAFLRIMPSLRIVYEDADLLAVDKPAGLLTQKASLGDLSVNDWLHDYIGKKEKALRKDADSARTDAPASLSPEGALLFTPSAMNRLDRNTSGLVLCAKTYRGARFLSAVLKERSLHKYYLALVAGRIREAKELSAFLVKDAASNTVFVTDAPDGSVSGADRIRTAYEPLAYIETEDLTLLKVCLITGKPHQIRAHLSFIGHPLAGDPKYGDRARNREFKKRFGISRQLLHAYEICFPAAGECAAAEGMACAGKVISCELPPDFRSVLGTNVTI